jgi:MoaA/NifB/PqqE/SkfB family radical SAM enzyme
MAIMKLKTIFKTIFKIVFENYDAFIYWKLTKICNLNCIYCGEKSHVGSVQNINIDALLDTLSMQYERVVFGFTGGEPFLVPNFVDACKEITKKHFIQITTNLTSPTIVNFSQEIDPKKGIQGTQ